MKLWINVTNNEIFDNLWDLLFSNDIEISKWFWTNFVWELEEELSPQYEIQVKSLSEMRKKFWKKILNDIEWIYWWTEQCEWLTPNLLETKKAIDQMIDFNKKYISHKKLQFAFLTPYWWSDLIKNKLIFNFDYLNENARHINKWIWKIEIIVNDLWTLQILQEKKYSNLIPVFWRLLCKQLKMPLVDSIWLEENIKLPWKLIKNKEKEEIEKLRIEFAKNQREVLSRSSLHTDYFTKFMKENNVYRWWLDYNEQFKKLFEDHTVDLDVYYPYSIVFVWRLCDTSALEDQKRWYYPIDRPCWRTCMLYDLCVNWINQTKFKIFQRWNSQFRSAINLENLSEKFINDQIYENRLIYTPMI